MTYTVKAEGICKSFGGHRRRSISVDLAVETGSVFALLGPNGAGKTTMVRILATLIRPDAGTATVAGHDLLHRPGRGPPLDQPHRPVRGRRRHAHRPGEPGDDGPAAAPAPAGGPGPGRRAAGRVRPGRRRATGGPPTYSGGMRRRLDLAISMIARPAAAVPGRADHRPRPAQPRAAVGHGPAPGRRGRHGPAHHPVPGGGRPARRHGRGARPRPDRRPGHAPTS